MSFKQEVRRRTRGWLTIPGAARLAVQGPRHMLGTECNWSRHSVPPRWPNMLMSYKIPQLSGCLSRHQYTRRVGASWSSRVSQDDKTPSAVYLVPWCLGSLSYCTGHCNPRPDEPVANEQFYPPHVRVDEWTLDSGQPSARRHRLPAGTANTQEGRVC
jgi:hypothetical protein